MSRTHTCSSEGHCAYMWLHVFMVPHVWQSMISSSRFFFFFCFLWKPQAGTGTHTCFAYFMYMKRVKFQQQIKLNITEVKHVACLAFFFFIKSPPEWLLVRQVWLQRFAQGYFDFWVTELWNFLVLNYLNSCPVSPLRWHPETLDPCPATRTRSDSTPHSPGETTLPFLVVGN